MSTPGRRVAASAQRDKASAPQKPVVAVIGTRGYPSFYGGFETAVRHLAPGLSDRGWHVRVYGRRGSRQERRVAPDLRVERVDTRGIASKSLGTLTFGLTAVLHALVFRPQVALVMNVANGFWLPLLKWRGVPTVVNVDGIEWERDKWGPLGKAVFLWGARFTARFADHLVFDAVAIADYWRHTFGRDGAFIPYGGEWIADTTPPEDLVAGKYALLVARFVPENSIDVFLDAAPSIIEELDLDIVLVGSAPDGDALLERTVALKNTHARVHHLGHLSDDSRLFGLWKEAGVYFHGHTVGGTNPALVQAMSLGARVVARDTVYNREVLGDIGHFCDDDPRSVVEAMRAALTDGRPLAAMARQRASHHYSWEMVCDRYHDALTREARRHLKVGSHAST